MKIRVVSYIFFVFVLFITQTTVLDYVKIYDVKPNLPLIFIVCVAFLRGSNEGAVTGFFTGLAYDMLVGRILGFHALFWMWLGFIIGSVNKRLYRENVVVITFFTAAATIVFESLVYLFSVLFDGNINIVYALTKIILPEALFNSIVSMLIYLAVIKLNHWVDEMDKSSRRY